MKPVMYARDVDGTGSLHPCSKEDDGAIALYAESGIWTPEMKGAAMKDAQRVVELTTALEAAIPTLEQEYRDLRDFQVSAARITRAADILQQAKTALGR